MVGNLDNPRVCWESEGDGGPECAAEVRKSEGEVQCGSVTKEEQVCVRN